MGNNKDQCRFVNKDVDKNRLRYGDVRLGYYDKKSML
jgi:hypothetical protein